ncbi:MAG: hypothetical protein A3J80_12025 [Desulfobacula sp. RIFOXYB2_FULL_45_6]|nr:MAG: hypothetical protein A3J80_12025 [Desulfobacula sp. RIFOXYB2_FULL_45_6]
MKPKENPEPKIPTTKTNTNKKKLLEITENEKKIDMSLLKKNEFAMILIGALLLTLIVFFFFFRTSDPVSQPVSPADQIGSLPPEIENRMEKLEQALLDQEKSDSSESGGKNKEKMGIHPLDERVSRLETAFSVKMESMIERMGKIEKQIAQLALKQDATPNAAEAKPEPAAAASEKKIVKKEKKESIFHTVQKGETLFSISKKYNTSVEALKKLNNLPANAAIFPGNNILVK